MGTDDEVSVLEQIIYTTYATLQEKGLHLNVIRDEVIQRVADNAPHTFLASELKSNLISTLTEIVSQVEKE